MNTCKYLFKFTIKKIHIIYLSLLIIFLGISGYGFYRYNLTFANFKTQFDSFNYSQANNILLTQENINPFKPLFINRDLKNYFSYKVNELYDSISNGNLSDEDILLQIKEIDRYNILSHEELTTLSYSLNSMKNSSSKYTEGISYFNNEDYTNALNCLKKVSYLDLNYNYAVKYINESKKKIKENILAYCDELASKDYYSKAISILTENETLSSNDPDIKNKIAQLKSMQQAYYDKNSSIAEATSNALTSTITPSNINTLNITSNTSYLINVNLDNQKTYIYKRKDGNWNLIRTCPCSTGISGEDTPCGSFSVQEKGDWFFSEKFEQGGKYWTQITGDILFHSVPFARDKKTILDYTLNSPASHGCIRLSVDDAKWIYSNVPRGSKILIK
ncbi:L,D-transpeptidase [Clostridium sp. SM-530-WT-3G]|uniref:L,D-transpeptidase n=1 Tax=Clostridium sp. SM-530-WT-3G TaxID=2725303 RepID=UPI00145E6119|nr:L,D-transpeptidase [Clostridium sp. SM-530-WT-3G]NME82275.1 L,D-transpeptidase family protein [Clostridium sp. SM-530-WT-3G]